ncbi:uncharacterized protein LOC118442548 [Vespa mandarinia]|uniref:uncharacterized protein LOC118442548 n=1 Tax=Vespa mandarinia TaxID=7446 RepID=UPI00160ECA26|nr:uncharacterized protein LOC118442548 [Vespa mandarinia]
MSGKFLYIYDIEKERERERERKRYLQRATRPCCAYGRKQSKVVEAVRRTLGKVGCFPSFYSRRPSIPHQRTCTPFFHASLSLSLFIHLSISISISLSLFLSQSLPPLSPSLSLSLSSPNLFLSFSLSLSLSLYYICVYIYIYIYLFLSHTLAPSLARSFLTSNHLGPRTSAVSRSFLAAAFRHFPADRARAVRQTPFCTSHTSVVVVVVAVVVVVIVVVIVIVVVVVIVIIPSVNAGVVLLHYIRPEVLSFRDAAFSHSLFSSLCTSNETHVSRARETHSFTHSLSLTPLFLFARARVCVCARVTYIYIYKTVSCVVISCKRVHM